MNEELQNQNNNSHVETIVDFCKELAWGSNSAMGKPLEKWLFFITRAKVMKTTSGFRNFCNSFFFQATCLAKPNLHGNWLKVEIDFPSNKTASEI